MQPSHSHLIASVLAMALLTPGAAWAQAVSLAGILGSKALLVVDGSAPRGVAAGETHQGVKVISVGRDEAVIETKGARSTVRLGEAPVSIGARTGSGNKVVLMSDSRGHFVNQGLINGKVMQFMVDTGATTVAIGQSDAQRLGLKYEQRGQPVMMNTANGTAQGWRMRLESVRVGDVELRSVDAIVTAEAMPYVLLGNSFLREFHMNRSGDEMVLQRRR